MTVPYALRLIRLAVTIAPIRSTEAVVPPETGGLIFAIYVAPPNSENFSEVVASKVTFPVNQGNEPITLLSPSGPETLVAAGSSLALFFLSVNPLPENFAVEDTIHAGLHVRSDA